MTHPVCLTAHRKGILALILLAAVFASMGLFARYLSTNFTLLQQVYLRVLMAFILGLIMFKGHLDFNKLRHISLKEWGLLLFRAATQYAFGVTLFSQAIITTKYTNVSFIGALPMTAILGMIFFKEKLTGKKALALTGALVGTLLIAIKDYSDLSSWGKGEVVTFISAIAFAFSYISRKWHSSLLNNQEIAQLVLFLSFSMLGFTSLFMGEDLPTFHWNAGLALALLGAGFFNVANLFLVNYGFQKVDAFLASNLLNLEGLFAILISFSFYHEVPNLKELIGGLIIVASVMLMNKAETRR